MFVSSYMDEDTIFIMDRGTIEKELEMISTYKMHAEAKIIALIIALTGVFFAKNISEFYLYIYFSSIIGTCIGLAVGENSFHQYKKALFYRLNEINKKINT